MKAIIGDYSMSEKFYEEKHTQFWRSFLIAADTEPRDALEITGASGLKHRVLATGVDDPGKRLVIVSAESDARTAAMAQNDIQNALRHTGIKVLTVRPIAFDLSLIAKFTETFFGKSKISGQDMKQADLKGDKAKEQLGPVVEGTLFSLQHGRLSISAQISQAIMQLSNISLDLVELPNDITDREKIAQRQKAGKSLKDNDLVIDFSNLLVNDIASQDRALGLCPLELYQMPESEAEVLQRGKDYTSIKEILKKRDILQYFFPPVDEIALGLMEYEAKSPSELIGRIEQSKGLGHPLSDCSILDAKPKSIKDVIGQLQDANLAVEGKLGYELTADGAKQRSLIKFKPKEGALSKICSVFRFNLDVTQWFNNVQININMGVQAPNVAPKEPPKE